MEKKRKPDVDRSVCETYGDDSSFFCSANNLSRLSSELIKIENVIIWNCAIDNERDTDVKILLKD